MYDNFENLQKKCKRYYLKKKAKQLLIIISLPLGVAIYLFLEENTQKKEKQFQVTQNIIKETKEILPKVEVQKKKRVIKDLPYTLFIDTKSPTYKKIQASETSMNKLDSIDGMIAYYEKNKKYSLAIEIAQYYYDNNLYSKSLLWAKKANLLDRDDEKAWIIYAQSEYAQNNHKRAIKILKLYLTNAISNEAKEQLIIWTQGKQK